MTRSVISKMQTKFKNVKLEKKRNLEDSVVQEVKKAQLINQADIGDLFHSVGKVMVEYRKDTSLKYLAN